MILTDRLPGTVAYNYYFNEVLTFSEGIQYYVTSNTISKAMTRDRISSQD
jgi:hypothetical protein